MREEPTTPSASPRLAPELVRRELTEYPATIDGLFSSIDTTGYDQEHRTLGFAPYEDSERSLTTAAAIARIWKPEALAAHTRLAIRGTIVGFGRPHFNSDDGTYWSPLMLDLPEGVAPVVPAVYREVQVAVSEVIADPLGAGVEPGDTLVYTARGGQVLVSPPSGPPPTALASTGDHVHTAVTEPFVFDDPPLVDLTIGDDVILLLDWVEFEGRYGVTQMFAYELVPAHSTQYVYRIVDGIAANADPVFEEEPRIPRVVDLPVDEFYRVLRANVDGIPAKPVPVPGLFPSRPSLRAQIPGEELVPPPDVPPHSHGDD